MARDAPVASSVSSVRVGFTLGQDQPIHFTWTCAFGNPGPDSNLPVESERALTLGCSCN